MKDQNDGGRLRSKVVDTPQNTARTRIGAGIALILTVACGLAVRRWLPWGFWSKYAGVALWSVALYVLLVLLRPRIKVATCVAVALLISWTVECAQLTPLSGWLSAQHPVLRLIVGEHFSSWDLPAYAAGVLLAAIFHTRIRAAAHSGSTTPAPRGGTS